MSRPQDTAERTILSVHEAFRTLEGDGFEVQRAIPSRAYEAIGPFIFLDQFGPIKVAPGEAKGASAHPHAGIETLTLLLEGKQVHKDSMGNESSMRPGEVQWMRAGRGVIHDESPDDELRRHGGAVHGVQLWINMPRGQKHQEPAYRHVKADEIPLVNTSDGVRARLVAGAIGDQTGPVSTSGTPFVLHVSMKAGSHATFDVGAAKELAAYVMVGAAGIGSPAQSVKAGLLARLTPGGHVVLSAEVDTELLLLGGDPLDAPIVRHGPFVMNTVDELERAVRDYYAGRMGRIAA
jgi:redox-sensitive bicupin YhaK (pirin superfamily)